MILLKLIFIWSTVTSPRSLVRRKSFKLLCFLALLLISLPLTVLAQSTNKGLKIIVNGNEDGPVTPDLVLTLREAISLVNGSLNINQLSDIEKAQVSPSQYSQIGFNLPPKQTTIYLQEVLPPLSIPGLIIDGTTQPGYNQKQSPTTEIAVPRPVVSITPANGAEVYRGLTITANNVTVRGLSIYGFNSSHRDTESSPPADIFIAHSFILPLTFQLKPYGDKITETENNSPPENVVIENNWLGITPEANIPTRTSAFGVYVFNSVGTKIHRNRISYHDGSAIITGISAKNLKTTENIITANGMAGMPDAIRLDGMIDGSEVSKNLICGNDGSGVFLFKTQGSTRIFQNQIKANARRLRRAAIYLMGNNHQVYDNQISYQAGAGIVVGSYPKSDKNMILNNQFWNLEGLSIDLNSFHNVENIEVQHWQNGDGPNPQRNSSNRRLDTANAAINTPRFLSREFFSGLGSTVEIDGMADPFSQIDVYLVSGKDNYGTLNKFLAAGKADKQGKFSISLANLQGGDRISAIATLPEYGTSEPAFPSVVRDLAGGINSSVNGLQVPSLQCLTPPPEIPPEIPPTIPHTIPPEIPPTIPPEIPPTPVKLKVPKNVHFALDKYNISPASAKVLNKIAQVLRDNPSIVVEIYGHTDIRANDKYNMRLGANRAKSTRNYLIRQGIAPERMTIRSFGERKLLTPGSEKLDHARNRRAEFIFQDIRGIEVIVQEEDLQLE